MYGETRVGYTHIRCPNDLRNPQMSSQHLMPFGATVCEDGSISFALWAPKAKYVELCLYGDGGEVKYTELRCQNGRQNKAWYSLTTDQAHVGSLYSYRIDRELIVPDPASRFNPYDVHGPSQVVDPKSYPWRDLAWHGRSWETAVIYEIHTGTFTDSGNFLGIVEKLDYLVSLGVTAIELMPIADFPGERNWGYDGVLLFAPDSSYGTPDDLKCLVDECHARGLMVFLDVVYNHFGPEGNYLGTYAPQFFSRVEHTPWGAAINFSGRGSRIVRDFFIHNALFWFEEYHIDGLRLDAVQSMVDKSEKHILTEIAESVRSKSLFHHRHLVLENEENASKYLGLSSTKALCSGDTSNSLCLYSAHLYNAQWNDDIHNAFHVLVTDEREGYYADFGKDPHTQLCRCLSEGFAYQGEYSQFRRKKRGEDSKSLAPTCFINFIQNHDRVGNLPYGDRMHLYAKSGGYRAASEILLLAPGIPLMFMGQEFTASAPFLFFCDFRGDLAQAVKEGRERDYRRRGFLTEAAEELVDPNDLAAFMRSKLSWIDLDIDTHREFMQLTKKLLNIRAKKIVPRIPHIVVRGGSYSCTRAGFIKVEWKLKYGESLVLQANLSCNSYCLSKGSERGDEMQVPRTLIYSTTEKYIDIGEEMPPWFVQWFWRDK